MKTTDEFERLTSPSRAIRMWSPDQVNHWLKVRDRGKQRRAIRDALGLAVIVFIVNDGPRLVGHESHWLDFHSISGFGVLRDLAIPLVMGYVFSLVSWSVAERSYAAYLRARADTPKD